MNKQQQYEELIDSITSVSVQSDNLREVLAQVLDRILDFFQADRAWFLTPCDPDAPSWRVPMERCRSGWPGAFAMEEDIPMEPTMAIAFANALKNREVWCFGPGYAEVPEMPRELFSVQAQMGMAIFPKVGNTWLFGLHHCETAYHYTQEDIYFFSGIAKQIATTLGNLVLLEQLRDSESFSRSLFYGSPAGLVLCDLEGKILDVNRAYAELFGYEQQECLGKAFEDLAAENGKQFFENIVHLLLRDRQFEGGEKNCRRKNGTAITVRLSATMIQREGSPLMLIAMEDITRQRAYDAFQKQQQELLESRVEERTTELQKVQAELLRRDKLATIGQLTSTVSHELRNPLGVIQSSLYLLQKRLSSSSVDAAVISALERIERSVQRCDYIIDELVEYTRAYQHSFTPVIVDHWLNDLLDCYPFPNDIEVRRQLQLGERLHSIETARLRRAVVHLLNNACQALSEKSTDMRCICVTTEAQKNRIAINIEDSGDGISPQVLQSVFEPLFSTRGFGPGLGLPMVKQVMEEHLGGVELSSTVGQGTCVTLWLPEN